MPAWPVDEIVQDRLLEFVMRVASASADGALLVDLGAGSGALTAPMSRRVAAVRAVESLQPELESLRALAASRQNISVVATGLADFDLPVNSVDLVISGRALHRLHNADKRQVVQRCHRWLRPSGQLVVGDVMFGRGFWELWRQIRTDSDASSVCGQTWPRRLAVTAQAVLRLGPTQPASADFWVRALQDAGFRDVLHREIGPGAGVVWGSKTSAITSG